MLFLSIDPTPLVDAVAQARSEVRVQARSTAHPAVIDSLRRAAARGVRVSTLLGPRPAYTLDGNGRPLVPRDMYGAGPDAVELRELERIGRVFISPQFSELGVDFVPGRRSAAYYVVVDGRKLVLCSGALDGSRSSVAVCHVSDQPRLVGAARDAHRSEADYEATSEQARQWQASAQKVLAIGPDDHQVLLRRLAAPGALVATSALTWGPAFEALNSNAPGKTLLIPRSMRAHPAVRALQSVGVAIRTQDGAPLAGTMIVNSDDSAFVGSHELTERALAHNRNVGVELHGDDARMLRIILTGLSVPQAATPTR